MQSPIFKHRIFIKQKEFAAYTHRHIVLFSLQYFVSASRVDAVGYAVCWLGGKNIATFLFFIFMMKETFRVTFL
jgi:hypothetical protein